MRTWHKASQLDDRVISEKFSSEPALVTFELDEDGQPNALEMMNARFTRR